LAAETQLAEAGTHTLVTPTNDNEWKAYHDIRRELLFEARGQFGVYDENHPDDKAPGHYPQVLNYGGDTVGVVRIDIDGAVATVRRVAIRADVQRRGHGRALLSLAQQFAENAGCSKLVSFVAPGTVGFYQRSGFEIAESRMMESSSPESVFMSKDLTKGPADCT